MRQVDKLPQTGFLRLAEVLHFYPVSKSTFWAGIRQGKYPPPVKLGERCTGWRCEDVRALIEAASDGRNWREGGAVGVAQESAGTQEVAS